MSDAQTGSGGGHPPSLGAVSGAGHDAVSSSPTAEASSPAQDIASGDVQSDAPSVPVSEEPSAQPYVLTDSTVLVETPEPASSTSSSTSPPAESVESTVTPSAHPVPISPTTSRKKQAHFAVTEVDSSPLSRTPSTSTASGASTPRTYTAPSWHRSPSSASSSPTRQSERHAKLAPEPEKSLREVAADLRSLLKVLLLLVPQSLQRLSFLIPPPLRRLSRAALERMAMALHKRGALASNMVYDLMCFLWKGVLDLFFREIRSRGGWKVPRDGGIIFVVGPHHNQFLDPLVLMTEVRRESGRRISFLIAEASMRRKFVGQAASFMQSISVVRAQDLAAAGPGTIRISPDDPFIILGSGTSFVADLAARKQLMLPKQFGNAAVEVVEVLDDGRVKVKKEFSKKASEALVKNGEEGSIYKILPHVDQSRMYSSVYKKLSDGGCIGIFPEGGSHDRTELLPLKAGVSIMALGALSSNPNLKLRIVPVGLSYFHPHRFRSRAVVEFGSPLDVPKELVDDFEKGGDEKRDAVGKMMALVVDGLKSVTVRAPDYETLMLIQATRRLYRPPGQHLTLGQIVELNKRFIAGYEVYKDEPSLKALVGRVKEYNTLLRYMGLKDHQVESGRRPLWRSIVLLLYRVGLAGAWSMLALPGVILNAPIFIAATYISRKKAKAALAASTVKIKARDVLATWKVLVALAGAPTLYSIYAIGATLLAFKFDLPRKYKIWAPILTMLGLPFIGYSALKFGEVGMDVYKSLRPLFLSVVPGNEKQLDKIRAMRASLQHDISKVVNEFGPQLFEDFQAMRIVPPTSKPAPPGLGERKRSTYGQGGQGTFLTHPMSWVDEYLFGWSTNPTRETQQLRGSESDGATSEGQAMSGYASGYTTDEPGDYDEVIHILSREQEANATSSSTEQPPLRRRVSRTRSRSQLDLTALAPSPNTSDASYAAVAATAVETKGEGLTKRTGAAGDTESSE